MTIDKTPVQTSNIHLKVQLNADKVPVAINWQASDSPMADQINEARAFMLSLWDGERKETMRIDLWTLDMEVQEMNHFIYQNILLMADSHFRATGDEAVKTQLYTLAQELAQTLKLSPSK